MQNGIIRVSDIRYDYIPSWNIQNLMAPFWRLYWNKAEGASVVSGKNEIQLLPNAYYLVPAHAVYRAKATCPVDHFYMHFYLGWAYPKRETLTFAMTREMKAYLRRILPLCKGRQSDAAKAEKLLIGHAMIFNALNQVPFERFETSAIDVKMEDAIEMMLDNLQTGITNDRLAEAAGMSLSTFLREFSKRYNITPAKYLNLLRVDLAASLLHHGNESIEEIAEDTGFYDRYHLTKVFKQHRNITPAAFRRLMQQK